VAEHLPSKCKALSSNRSTARKKKSETLPSKRAGERKGGGGSKEEGKRERRKKTIKNRIKRGGAYWEVVTGPSLLFGFPSG
jgi:hypothetical protein